MKMHESLIERLVSLMQNYGGSDGEKKLKAHLQSLDLSEYAQKSGNKVLVETGLLHRKLNKLE